MMAKGWAGDGEQSASLIPCWHGQAACVPLLPVEKGLGERSGFSICFFLLVVPGG